MTIKECAWYLYITVLYLNSEVVEREWDSKFCEKFGIFDFEMVEEMGEELDAYIVYFNSEDDKDKYIKEFGQENNYINYSLEEDQY